MEQWVNLPENRYFWQQFGDMAGRMLTGFSEPIALLPYLLRSLRIKKLFDMRELYCETEKMPKDEIWDWRERRVIKLLVGGLLVYCAIGFVFWILGLVDDTLWWLLPNFNVIS